MTISASAAVMMLKAAAEPTRLRILVLLAGGELNVKDLTRILGQSQPRISRHLKLLTEAGLIERTQDGSWAYFQLVPEGPTGALVRPIIEQLNTEDVLLQRDRARAEQVKREREASAQAYFREHAPEWDRIRALHVAEAEVEGAVRRALGPGPFDLLVDLGTGTGRVLEFLVDRYEQALGIDINHAMLAYARGKLAEGGITHAQVRYGDLYALSLGDGVADAVVVHQVLHFLADPPQALREAARILAPGGRLVIVDFAPHQLEFLRDAHAHERLGLEAAQVSQWLADAGLIVRRVEALAPSAGAGQDKLTVTLWIAERPHAAAAVDTAAPGTGQRRVPLEA